jgi:phage terminase large subunit-like protein
MNWKVRPSNSLYFDRKWCAVADRIPLGAKCVRAYDKAGTAPSDKEPSPDYTAQVGMAKDKEGYYYIFGNFHPSFKDPDSKVTGVIRKTVGERDNLIELQAVHDGTDVTIIFPKDPSASGKYEFIESSKKLINKGYVVKADPMPSNKSKMTKFAPFASACENGLVKIVASTFDAATLEFYLLSTELFSGQRSSKTYKDDIPDCLASAFNALNTIRTYTVPKLTALNDPTIKAQYDLNS